MDSDLDIARKATTRPIQEVADKLGLERSDLILQGSSIAKISWDRLKQAGEGEQGFLILVTSVNPTPFGEGKTCLLYTSPSPRDRTRSRMPSSA